MVNKMILRQRAGAECQNSDRREVRRRWYMRKQREKMTYKELST